MANIAAINTKQHGGANNEKLKLETLVRYVGANHQAIIIDIIINCYGLKKAGNLQNRAEKLKSQKKYKVIGFKCVL